MFFTNGATKIFLRWVFYIFIAVFPFILYEGYLFNGTSTRAINTVFVVQLLAVIVGCALLVKKNKLSIVRSPITIVVGLFLLIMVISSVAGVDLQTSFWSKATRTTGLFYFIHLALWYIFFWMAFDERSHVRNFLKTFAISAGLFSLVALMGREGLGWIYNSKEWAGFTIGNSTFAGMYLYAGFMIGVYVVTTASKAKWWHFILPLVCLINPYLVNFDLFRGEVFAGPLSIIGSAQASSVTLFFSVLLLIGFWAGSKIKTSTTRKTLLIATSIFGVIVFAIGAHSLLTPGSAVQKIYLQQSTATRPIVWEFSKKAIAERPVFGWGLDNFDRTFQKYYDNRILEMKNGGEAWLDRAHNIFIDQTIETGYVGTIVYVIVYLVILGCLIYVIIRSKERHDVILASILLVYFAGHLIELQTAFDTTITYVLLASFAVIAAQLYARTRNSTAYTMPFGLQVTKGGVLIVAVIILFAVGTVPIMRAEGANGAIRRVGSSEKRIPIYHTLFSGPLDTGAFLWRTSADIQRGVSLDPKVLDDPRQREGLKKEFAAVGAAYEEYLKEYPDDYRALLNLADVYIYERLFEVDRLNDAHRVLDHAIEVVPQSPQAYWMQAVAYLYQAKFKEAQSWAQKAYELNPGVEESTRLKEYIAKATKEFPVIDLYSFKQI